MRPKKKRAAKTIRNIRDKISEGREPFRGNLRIYGVWGASVTSGHKLVAEIWNWGKHRNVTIGQRNEPNL